MKHWAVGLLLAGVALVVAGLALGLAPVHRAGQSCGSGLSPSTTSLIGSGAEDICSSATSDRKTFALVVIAPGAIALIGAAGAGVMLQGRRFQPVESSAS